MKKWEGFKSSPNDKLLELSDQMAKAANFLLIHPSERMQGSIGHTNLANAVFQYEEWLRLETGVLAK